MLGALGKTEAYVVLIEFIIRHDNIWFSSGVDAQQVRLIASILYSNLYLIFRKYTVQQEYHYIQPQLVARKHCVRNCI